MSWEFLVRGVGHTQYRAGTSDRPCGIRTGPELPEGTIAGHIPLTVDTDFGVTKGGNGVNGSGLTAIEEDVRAV